MVLLDLNLPDSHGADTYRTSVEGGAQRAGGRVVRPG